MRERFEINAENQRQHENNVNYGVRVATGARCADGRVLSLFGIMYSSSRITSRASAPKNLYRIATTWFRCAQTIIELRSWPFDPTMILHKQQMKSSDGLRQWTRKRTETLCEYCFQSRWFCLP